MTSNRRRWDGTASWLPTPEQIAAANLERADERRRLAKRIDDGPLTVLHHEGYGKTPGHDKPVPKWLRIWRRTRIALRDRLYFW
jgi:hypothetical protein